MKAKSEEIKLSKNLLLEKSPLKLWDEDRKFESFDLPQNNKHGTYEQQELVKQIRQTFFNFFSIINSKNLDRKAEIESILERLLAFGLPDDKYQGVAKVGYIEFKQKDEKIVKKAFGELNSQNQRHGRCILLR